MCIKFWYYIVGETGDQLTLELTLGSNQPSVIWQATAALGDTGSWRLARVNAEVSNYYSLVFNATALSSGSVVALDDVSLEEDSCEPSGACDFERGFCGWRSVPIPNPPNDPTGDAAPIWLRNSGATPSPFSGPKSDHTTGTTLGKGFFYMRP